MLRRSSDGTAFLLLPVPRSTRVLHLRCSVCSSSVGCGFPFLSPSASACVAVRLFWPPPRSVRQWCWVARGCVFGVRTQRSRQPPIGGGCMASPCSRRGWPSTIRWFPHSVAQGYFTRSVLTLMGSDHGPRRRKQRRCTELGR